LFNLLFGLGILPSVLAAEDGSLGLFADVLAAGSLAIFEAGVRTKGLTAGITGTLQAGSLVPNFSWTRHGA